LWGGIGFAFGSFFTGLLAHALGSCLALSSKLNWKVKVIQS
jgi:hypothetical protein